MSNELEIEALLDRLDEVARRTCSNDAIDRTLANAPRTTAVGPLRHHEAVRRFREELARGMVQADTARQLLGLVRAVMDGMVTP